MSSYFSGRYCPAVHFPINCFRKLFRIFTPFAIIKAPLKLLFSSFFICSIAPIAEHVFPLPIACTNKSLSYGVLLDKNLAIVV